MKKTFAIFIGSEQKGLLIAMAKVLEDKYHHTVKIVARDRVVKQYIEKLLPKRKDDIILSDIDVKIDINNVIEEANCIEKSYGINLSILMSEDRALGQGYLSNVENIPDIIRASWPHEKKLLEIVTYIKKYEIALSGVDYMIRMHSEKHITKILEEKGGKLFALVSMKYGDRYFWSDNDFITSTKLIEHIKNNINSLKYNNHSDSKYQIQTAGEISNSNAKYSFSNATKVLLKILFNDTKNFIRRINKKNSYHYLGWAPSAFRRVFHYRYVKSISATPDDLNKNYRVCFFALHLEPEIALLSYSPEFSNSLEAITWISKSLPADTLLVVKEQALSFGVRSRWYYNQLNKMGNVVLADPDIHSWEWIKRSIFVATITGTVGIEAVHFHKPVLSFGAHQIINHLKTVRFVSNFVETKNAINEFLTYSISEIELKKSRQSLVSAQLDCSFELPEYKGSYKSNKLEINMATIALENLFTEYKKTFQIN
jgi:hypothetical protein